jgi:hypothetical protein
LFCGVKSPLASVQVRTALTTSVRDGELLTARDVWIAAT